jgi:molybdate transport system permease protein
MRAYGPAILATLQVAAGATAISLLLGTWLGHWLRGRRTAIAAASAPLILPPTIICSYFLFRPFTIAIAISAAAVHWVPALARSARVAFQSLDPQMLNAARIAGASEWRVFWRVALPLSVRPLLSAAAWGFGLIASEYAATLWIAQVHFTPQ